MKHFCTSAAGLIADITPDPTLQNVLAGSALLYGGLKDVSTFYEHAMINHSYIEGAYRFVDGSMQVSLELINVIRANGGTVLNNSEATRIIVENEKSTGSHHQRRRAVGKRLCNFQHAPSTNPGDTG